MSAAVRRPSLARRLLVGVAQWIAIVAITLLIGELAARFLFGVRPLETEALVWDPHPRWGWFHRPNASALFVKPGFSQQVEINSRGLREREIPYEKPEGVQRVLVIGDSSVVSFEVPPEAAFPRVAEDLLRSRGYAVEFVNGGVRGFGTDQTLLFLKEEGLRYQPDLVLYKWTDNDPDDNATIHRPFRRFGKPWFALEDGDRLVLKGVPVPDYPYEANLRVDANGELKELPVGLRSLATLYFRDVVVCHSAFATGLLKVALAMPGLTRSLVRMGSYQDREDVDSSLDRNAPLFRVTAAMVREMERVANEAGAQFRLIGVGDKWGRALVEVTGVGTLDEIERYKAGIQPGVELHAKYDPHWNEAGHLLYGTALADALEAAGLVRRDGSPEPERQPDR
jgi:hypothetical protein